MSIIDHRPSKKLYSCKFATCHQHTRYLSRHHPLPHHLGILPLEDQVDAPHCTWNTRAITDNLQNSEEPTLHTHIHPVLHSEFARGLNTFGQYTWTLVGLLDE